MTFKSCQTQLGLEGTAEAGTGLGPVGLFPAAPVPAGGAAGLRVFAGATLCLQCFKPFSPSGDAVTRALLMTRWRRKMRAFAHLPLPVRTGLNPGSLGPQTENYLRLTGMSQKEHRDLRLTFCLDSPKR